VLSALAISETESATKTCPSRSDSYLCFSA
jgi:hypothetical protein